MAKYKDLGCESIPRNVKINLNEMPKYQTDAMCKTILGCAKRFFENPENRAEFERWKNENKENRV